MVLPNFFVIGAGKAGTTALYFYLKKHPDIFMCPDKEPAFFYGKYYQDDCGEKERGGRLPTVEAYSALFEGAEGYKAVGEATPGYLEHPRVPERIHGLIPEAKIIAILRDPAERMFSYYCYARSQGLESRSSFEEALKDDVPAKYQQDKRCIDYKSGLYYYKFLKPYYEVFERAKIKIYLYEDFKKDPQSIMKDIFCFLDVDSDIDLDFSKKHNVTQRPHMVVEKILLRPNPVKSVFKNILPRELRRNIRDIMYKKSLGKPRLKISTRKMLIRMCRDDIRELEKLLGRDLCSWKR